MADLKEHARSWTTAMITAIFAIVVILLQSSSLFAESVAVRYREGSVHGFLVLRSLSKTIAAGDLTQVIRGNQILSHLVFRFKDGSIDDETTTFSQDRTFRLIRDRHIQKGPAFPHPIDLLINAPSGQITVRSPDKSGREKVETSHLDLPPDLANGIILDILKNIRPDIKELKVSYLAATPKPRLIKLSITPQGQDHFSVGGIRHQAMQFLIKFEIGGLAGFIAPLLNKQPEDIKVWISGGEAPAFVRLDGPLFLGGPTWSLQMSSPVWPQAGP
jgi:hypothetical protein